MKFSQKDYDILIDALTSYAGKINDEISRITLLSMNPLVTKTWAENYADMLWEHLDNVQSLHINILKEFNNENNNNSSERL